jgi:hypothetical protein
MTPLQKASSIAKAQAFAIAMYKLSGVAPDVQIYDDYVEVSWSDAQRREFVGYLDRQILTGARRLFQPTEILDEPPPDVQIRWGDVIIPWSIRYTLPAMVAVFLAGYVARGLLR